MKIDWFKLYVAFIMAFFVMMVSKVYGIFEQILFPIGSLGVGSITAFVVVYFLIKRINARRIELKNRKIGYRMVPNYFGHPQYEVYVPIIQLDKKEKYGWIDVETTVQDDIWYFEVPVKSELYNFSLTEVWDRPVETKLVLWSEMLEKTNGQLTRTMQWYEDKHPGTFTR